MLDASLSYQLPFESFDWRAFLVNHDVELAIQESASLAASYKEEDHDIEWKDDDALLEFALEHNLFDKLATGMKKRAENRLNPNGDEEGNFIEVTSSF